MIRAVGYLLTEAFWTLVFRVAGQRLPEAEDPQSTADQVAARTKWIRENRPDRR